jgi:hypothetical protein
LQEPMDFKFVSFIQMVRTWDWMWINFLRKKRREMSSHNKAICLLQYIIFLGSILWCSQSGHQP